MNTYEFYTPLEEQIIFMAENDKDAVWITVYLGQGSLQCSKCLDDSPNEKLPTLIFNKDNAEHCFDTYFGMKTADYFTLRKKEISNALILMHCFDTSQSTKLVDYANSLGHELRRELIAETSVSIQELANCLNSLISDGVHPDTKVVLHSKYSGSLPEKHGEFSFKLDNIHQTDVSSDGKSRVRITF